MQSVFQPQEDYATQTLLPERMPSGTKIYKPTIMSAKASDISPSTMSSIELLMQYLDLDNAEEVFRTHARAYSLSILDPTKSTNHISFAGWNEVMEKVNSQIHFTDEDYVLPGTFFGKWTPRQTNIHLCVFAGILFSSLKSNRNSDIPTCAILDDTISSRTEKYEQEWNGFWQFFNVMQFNERFIAVSQQGLDNHGYIGLPQLSPQMTSEYIAPLESTGENDPWSEVKSILFDEESIALVDLLKQANLQIPDEVGFELTDISGEVIAEIELAWIDKKVAFLTKEQESNSIMIEKMGWNVFRQAEKIVDFLKEGTK